MKEDTTPHSDKGLKRILSRAWAYSLFRALVGRKQTIPRFVHEHVKPTPGCRILDIGCGPAEIVLYLPHAIGEYTGFDINPDYIASAKQHWGDRANVAFYCQDLRETTALPAGHYDIVLAIGIIHHLSDHEADALFRIAHNALASGGALVTFDNVYLQNQQWFAKWLISKDRGKAVRTAEDYKSLASPYFSDIEGTVLHDTLKIPYTIFVMKCRKG